MKFESCQGHSSQTRRGQLLNGGPKCTLLIAIVPFPGASFSDRYCHKGISRNTFTKTFALLTCNRRGGFCKGLRWLQLVGF